MVVLPQNQAMEALRVSDGHGVWRALGRGAWPIALGRAGSRDETMAILARRRNHGEWDMAVPLIAPMAGQGKTQSLHAAGHPGADRQLVRLPVPRPRPHHHDVSAAPPLAQSTHARHVTILAVWFDGCKARRLQAPNVRMRLGLPLALLAVVPLGTVAASQFLRAGLARQPSAHHST